MYVLKHGDQAEKYSDLPQNSTISPLVGLWKGAFKPLALLGLGLTALAGFLHYVKVGPNSYEADEKPKA